MPERITTSDDQELSARYFFIVARDRPDILQQARTRFHDDARIEVITDRRYGERRSGRGRSIVERRLRERRKPVGLGSDLRVYPSVVAQKHRMSYAELEETIASLSRQCDELTTENDRLCNDVATLKGRLEALMALDAARRTEVSVALAEAERALSAIRDRAAPSIQVEAKSNDQDLRSA